MLQAALGHRVSTALASQLHQLVGGSPTLLQAVVSEQIERGNLVLSGSVWTLLDEVVLDGRTGTGGHRQGPLRPGNTGGPGSHRSLVLRPDAWPCPGSPGCTGRESSRTWKKRARSSSTAPTGTSLPWATAIWATSSGTGSAWSAGWSCGTRFPGHQQHELGELTVEDLLAYAAWTHDCHAQLAPAHALAAARPPSTSSTRSSRSNAPAA